MDRAFAPQATERPGFAAVAIGTLASKFPRIELASDSIEHREMFNLRGLKSLPVKLG